MIITQELKAKAFDLLMDKMDGRHRLVGNKSAVVGVFQEGRREASLRVGGVPIFEWALRSDGRSDLKALMLDEAAKALGESPQQQEPKL